MNIKLKLINIALTALAIPFAMSAAEQGLVATAPNGNTVTVTAITPYIFKVTNAPAGYIPPVSKATVLNADTDIKCEYAEDCGVQSIRFTDALAASVDKRDGKLTISGKNFTLTDDGIRRQDNGFNSLVLKTGDGGTWLGAGERGHAMTLNGDTLTMYNRANYGYGAGDPRNSQMNISMPLLVSSKGYALLFDDHAAATLIAGNPVEYITENPSPVSYYVVDGSGSLSTTVSRLTSLTGRQELPPIWALGYITSKYGYHNNNEMLGALDSLKREGYPVDGVVLDLYWYGREQDMGRLGWDEFQWPGHRATLSKAKDIYGVNTVLISQPFVLRNGRGVDNFNELRDSGLLLKDKDGKMQDVEIWVGEGGMFDVSNPETRRWLADRYRSLTDEGVDGWWGDLGEPERHPESAVHANGLPARLYHNQYGNDWSSILFNLYDSIYPQRRVFTLMRGGTTGLQRYGVFPWSSDVSRSWEGMQAQIPVMIHSGVSGLGYMSHDVGGFAVDPEHPSDAEMYLRWMQLGVYSPVLRTHAQYMAEPYHYPDYSDALLKLVKERYRLLPYIYTAAYENASAGLPIVRPVWFYDNNVERLAEVDDEYLFGSSLLVAPVMKPGVRSRKVVFPSGEWIDIYDASKIYKGGSEYMVDAPLHRIPVFVRAGAFIPIAEYAMDNTSDYRTGVYTVEYYPVDGVSSAGLLYDDDDPWVRHAVDEKSRVIEFSGESTAREIVIDARVSSECNDAVGADRLDFVIKGVTAEPETVYVDGVDVPYDYDADIKSLRLSTRLYPCKILNIKIVK